MSLNTQKQVGYDLGSVAWFPSAMKCPRKGCGLPSCEIQE